MECTDADVEALIILFAVNYLSHRHIQATSMTDHSLKYFEELTQTCSPQLVDEWQSDIANAEGRRLDDITVMDILRTRQPQDMSASAQPLDESAGDDPVHIWLTLAIAVEERQYVLVH